MWNFEIFFHNNLWNVAKQIAGTITLPWNQNSQKVHNNRSAIDLPLPFGRPGSKNNRFLVWLHCFIKQNDQI